MKGEKKDLNQNLIPQIRALLTFEGFMTEEEAEQLIERARREVV